MSKVNSEVVAEIYRAMEKLGAGSDLLGIVGSWGDSLPESQVLSMLRGWNNEDASRPSAIPTSVLAAARARDWKTLGAAVHSFFSGIHRKAL